MSNIKEYNDLMAFHPGSYIEDIIDDLNITQKEYAEKLDVTEKTLSKLINGKISLSNEIAHKLSLATGVSMNTWQNIQGKYDEMIIEIEKEQELDENRKILNLIDYSYLKDLKLVENIKTSWENKIRNICRAFGISSLTYFTEIPVGVSYRNPSLSFEEKTIINSNVMLEIANMIANQIEAPRYNKSKLESLLEEFNRQGDWTLLEPQEYVNRWRKRLHDCGIILVILPHLKNAGINGAVKKLKSGSILLMLNDRGKEADIFWFSLLHEISHILNDEYEVNLMGNDFKNKNEENADGFARDMLIDKDAYDKFIIKNDFSEIAVRNFSDYNNIHPGIVVGRLQNDGYINYSDLYNLKSKIKVKCN